MKRTGVTALAVAGLALAGCGSSGSSTSSAPSPPASAPGAPDLQAQLLSLSDMPTGWSVDNSGSSSGSTPDCLKHVTKFSAGAKAHVSASYQDGSNGLPAVEEGLNYAPGSGASSELAAFNSELQGCGRISFTSGGHTFTGTIGQLAFPTVGDASDAYQLVVSSPVEGLTVTAGFDIIALRKGSEVAAVLYGDLGTPDVSQAEQFVNAAAAKIPTS